MNTPQPRYDIAPGERHKSLLPPGWAILKSDWGSGPEYYSDKDGLQDQMERLPQSDEVQELVGRLRVSILRNLAIEVINGSIMFVRSGERLDFAKLLNSWVATAEETIAAGSRLDRILSRRKGR